MKYRIFLKCSAVILMMSFFSVLVGCREKGHKVYPATGKVIYKGAPLGNAQISFHPKNSSGFVASAITKPDGTFSLLTTGALSSGAIAGEYDVLVSKTIVVDEKGNPIENTPEEKPSPAPQMESSSKIIQRPKMKSVIPEKYAQIDKPLLQAVVATKTNDYLFTLDDE
jgi:hypothetical protein